MNFVNAIVTIISKILLISNICNIYKVPESVVQSTTITATDWISLLLIWHYLMKINNNLNVTLFKRLFIYNYLYFFITVHLVCTKVWKWDLSHYTTLNVKISSLKFLELFFLKICLHWGFCFVSTVLNFSDSFSNFHYGNQYHLKIDIW